MGRILQAPGSPDLVGLSDTPDSLVGDAGKVLAVKAGEDGYKHIVPSVGATTFNALTDTPASKVGSGNFLVRVNASATTLEYLNPSTDFLAQYALADKSRPATWVSAADLSARSLADLGTRAHSDLTDFEVDNHTIYALLAGRAGGLVQVGGTAPNDNYTIRATSSTTDGAVIIETDPTTEVARFISVGTPAIPTFLMGQTSPPLAGKDVIAINSTGNDDRIIRFNNDTNGTLASCEYFLASFSSQGGIVATSPSFTPIVGRQAGRLILKSLGGGSTGLQLLTQTADPIDSYTNQVRRGGFTSIGVFETLGEIDIGGDLNHDGSNVGLFGVTPAPRPATATITNDSADRVINLSSFTLNKLGDFVATMYRDLDSLGALQV